MPQFPKTCFFHNLPQLSKWQHTLLITQVRNSGILFVSSLSVTPPPKKSEHPVHSTSKVYPDDHYSLPSPSWQAGQHDLTSYFNYPLKTQLTEPILSTLSSSQPRSPSDPVKLTPLTVQNPETPHHTQVKAKVLSGTYGIWSPDTFLISSPVTIPLTYSTPLLPTSSPGMSLFLGLHPCTSFTQKCSFPRYPHGSPLHFLQVFVLKPADGLVSFLEPCLTWQCPLPYALVTVHPTSPLTSSP